MTVSDSGLLLDPFVYLWREWLPMWRGHNKVNRHTRSKHIKGSKERYLLGQKYNLKIFGVIPFIKLQNDT